jgi:hypothetical protein
MSTIDTNFFGDINNYSCSADEYNWFLSLVNLIYPDDKATRDAYINYYTNNICTGIGIFATTINPSITLPPSTITTTSCDSYKPTSIIPYDDDDITSITYNFNNFQDVIKYSEKFIINEFTSQLKNNLNDKNFCRQNTIITSSTNVFIPPGVILDNCILDININQNIAGSGLGVEADNLCVNINERLKYMTNEERNKFLNDAVDKLQVSLLLNPNFENRKKFINELCLLLKNNMNSSPSNSNTSCSQQTIIKSLQNVTISPPGGILRCKGCSRLTINNDAFVKPYMNCVIEPIWTNISNNPILSKYFNEGDRSSCIYQSVQITPCDTVTKKYKSKIEILRSANLGDPPESKYECKYFDGQIIENDCTVPGCEVSSWSEWSVCKFDLDTNKGKQSRIRKYIKDGEGCEGLNMKEERECELTREQLAPIVKYKGEFELQKNKLNSINNSNNWINLITGNKFQGKSQIILLSLIIIFVIILLIFILK